MIRDGEEEGRRQNAMKNYGGIMEGRKTRWIMSSFYGDTPRRTMMGGQINKLNF